MLQVQNKEVTNVLSFFAEKFTITFFLMIKNFYKLKQNTYNEL